MKWIIDRFEDDIAVIEIGDLFIDVPKNALPDGAQVGDVIELTVDSSQTIRRKQNIDNLMNNLFKD